MRLKQLRGLPVIDPTTARKVGSVLDYQIDPALGGLAALDVGALDAAEGDGERIVARRIRRIGRNAVILNATVGSSPAQPPRVDERWLDASTLVGLEVFGDDGDRVGQLVDAVFNQDSLSIQFYVLGLGTLQRVIALIGHRDRILPDRILSCSRELMLLSTGAATNLLPAQLDETQPGLPVPLRVDDRSPAPSFESEPTTFEPVPESQTPAAAQTR